MKPCIRCGSIEASKRFVGGGFYVYKCGLCFELNSRLEQMTCEEMDSFLHSDEMVNYPNAIPTCGICGKPANAGYSDWKNDERCVAEIHDSFLPHADSAKRIRKAIKALAKIGR